MTVIYILAGITIVVFVVNKLLKKAETRVSDASERLNDVYDYFINASK